MTRLQKWQTASSTTSKRAKHSAGDLLGVPRRAKPERIREYTIRKIIKTEFVNTSFYRFLLLRIKEKSSAPLNSKTHRMVRFFYSLSKSISLYFREPTPIFSAASSMCRPFCWAIRSINFSLPVATDTISIPAWSMATGSRDTIIPIS